MRFLIRSGASLLLCICAFGTAATAAESKSDAPPSKSNAAQPTRASQPLTETITGDTPGLLVPQAGEDRSIASWSEYYETSLENEEYAKAADAAAEMVAIAQDARGDDSKLATQAMLALAWAQREAGELLPSARSYGEAVGMIERREGIFSEELINPLIELGVTYRKAGEQQLALDAYLRARHITHRQEGLFNTRQIPIVDLLTELYVATGEISDANREQHFAFRIVEHDCNEVEVCMVEGIYKMAKWHARTGRNAQARKLYRRAMEAIEAEYGENDLRLVKALHGLAASYEKEGFRRKEGEQSLERAVAIHASQPYGDSVEHASALARLGDWHTLNSDFEEAKAAYERAWQVMVDQGASREQANSFFAQPARLRYSPPIPIANDQAWHLSKLLDASVVVDFTVTEQGRVTDATVVEADVSRRVHHEVRDAVKRARYRPRLVDGEVVATRGVQLEQTFKYAKSVTPREDDPFERRRQMCPGCDL